MAEEHDGEVSNNELVGTSTDLSNFEALTLNDTPQTLESTDRAVMHVDTVDSGMLDSTVEPSTPEKKKPSYIAQKYWPPENEGDISFAERQAEKEYAESQAQSLQARGQYTFVESPEKKKPSYIARKYWPPENQGDISFARRQAEKEYKESQAQSLQSRGQCTYASKEEIARNAKKWMSKEAMVAFRRYIETEDSLKELEYEFDELLHQCFNVKHYFMIFHHLNFTVKLKKCGSADWESMMYFAEVKEILQTKHYLCYPLALDENGQCYACQNQGMHELRHPSVDIFDPAQEATTFPYYYEESDSDESHSIVGESESDYDMV